MFSRLSSNRWTNRHSKPPLIFMKSNTHRADHSVMRKTLYTASFLFSFRDHVPNQDILVNPLGLTITYFREDQAFLK